jgi:hypothetical protein
MMDGVKKEGTTEGLDEGSGVFVVRFDSPFLLLVVAVRLYTIRQI